MITSRSPSVCSRIKACTEVLIVLVFWAFIASILRQSKIVQWEVNTLGWSFITGILRMMFPVAILLLTHRNLKAYGFTARHWRYDLDLGMTCYLVHLIPWGLGYGLIILLHSSYTQLVGAFILAVAYSIATVVILVILQRQTEEDIANKRKVSAVRLNLFILVGLLSIPILVGLIRNALTVKLLSTLLWQFTISGFGEEIFYRGYIQSRLNESFGCPYQVLGVRFGWGLIITALLFSLTHVLNTYDPSSGVFELAWCWGFWTFFSGLFFGLIREKTGSVIAAGIAHGLPDAVGEAFGQLFF